ncbi:MAG: hypothetical protein AB1798_00375 [Spirochaetota bacterium]
MYELLSRVLIPFTYRLITFSSIQIVVAGTYRVEVNCEFDPHLLGEVVKALESLA